jgi:hypothetical protein
MLEFCILLAIIFFFVFTNEKKNNIPVENYVQMTLSIPYQMLLNVCIWRYWYENRREVLYITNFYVNVNLLVYYILIHVDGVDFIKCVYIECFQ